MKNSLTFLLVLVLGLVSPQMARGQPTTGDLEAKLQAAETGDPSAQLGYAKALRTKDLNTALVWAQKAADQGLAEAWYWIGTNKGPAATEFFFKAAELGYVGAFNTLFDTYLFRAGKDANIQQAKRLADIAREKKIKWTWNSEESADTVDRCYEAGKPEVPDSEKLTETERLEYAEKNCASFGKNKEYVSYRKCLLAKSDPDFRELGAIYGNGWGVRRNALKAISFFCHSSDVPAELENIVRDLYLTKNDLKPAEKFTFCNYASSGMNEGICSAASETAEEEQRDAKFDTITQHWQPAKQAAFKSLQAAAEKYFDTRSNFEIDQSGSRRAAFTAEELGKLRNQFLIDIKSPNLIPTSSEGDLKSVDVTLNEMYGKILRKDKDFDMHGWTTTPEGIKKTERSWLKYRDAWIKFSSVQEPHVPAVSLQAELTKRRVKELETFKRWNH